MDVGKGCNLHNFLISEWCKIGTFLAIINQNSIFINDILSNFTIHMWNLGNICEISQHICEISQHMCKIDIKLFWNRKVFPTENSCYTWYIHSIRNPTFLVTWHVCVGCWIKFNPGDLDKYVSGLWQVHFGPCQVWNMIHDPGLRHVWLTFVWNEKTKNVWRSTSDRQCLWRSQATRTNRNSTNDQKEFLKEKLNSPLGLWSNNTIWLTYLYIQLYIFE